MPSHNGQESILRVCFSFVGHRHVVLPQDIAKLLRKGVLLAEARSGPHKRVPCHCHAMVWGV